MRTGAIHPFRHIVSPPRFAEIALGIYRSCSLKVIPSLAGRKFRRKNQVLQRAGAAGVLLILLMGLIPPSQASAAAPVVSASDTATVYPTTPSTQVVVDSTITVEYGDNIISSARVAILDNFKSSEDALVFTTTDGIMGSYNSATGVLTLTGTATSTDVNFQNAFRQVKYRNSSSTPNTLPRIIQFSVGNSIYNPGNGHYYEWVSASSITWSSARTRAENKSSYGSGSGYPQGMYGLQGYLTTVTSSEENTFIFNRLKGQGWMGASDADVNKVWRWKTGPEGLEDGGKGRLFFRQNGWTSDTGPNGCGTGASPSQPSSTYTNWASGEPNDFSNGCAGNEDYSHFLETGYWNDYAINNTSISGYVVEYGGMSGDPSLQTFDSVTVKFASDTNTAPVFTEVSPVSIGMSVNGSPTPFSLTLHASDADSDEITWSISTAAQHGTAGASGTGTSKSISYSPVTNYYGSDSFVVRVADAKGGFNDLRVMVTIDSPPSDISLSNSTLPENQPSGTVVGAFGTTDPDNSSGFTYALVSGAGDSDNSTFYINGGSLYTASSFNYEIRNSYSVRVRTTDPFGLFFEKAFSITVSNVNEAPVITSNGGGATAGLTIAENTTAVTTVTASDPENAPLSFSITGGVDSGKFSIGSSTGALAFASAPDYDVPGDSDKNNIYELTVQVSDGSLTDSQAISVTVSNVNETPNITSNGGGATASLSIAENTTAVTTVTASDPENAPLSFSITGGADSGKFSIGSSTGALAFASAPDYDVPGDSDKNNIYELTVQVSDGSLTDNQAISVTVSNVNETPNITSNGGGATASLSVAENTTVVTTVTASDPENAPLSFSITGGADSGKFSIGSSTGVLVFASAPDYDVPGDSDKNNIYELTVQVSDGSLTDSQAISVTVSNVNETPNITSNGGGATASLSVVENTTVVTTVTASDPENAPLSFSITGGADSGKFSIGSSTGVLVFASAPDYDVPGDSDKNNIYELTVQVSDGSLTDSQAISVTVSNVNETPNITSNGGGATASLSVVENTTVVTTVTASDPENAPLSFSITGGADSGKFSIGSSTGVLVFAGAPDYDVPGDSDKNNIYEVTVQVSDGSLTDSQAISVTVTAQNESPTDIRLSAAHVAENQSTGTTIGNLDTDDPDAAESFTYSLVNGGLTCPGTQNGNFEIVSNLLKTVRTFDFEITADQSHMICIQTQDSGGLIHQKEFTIQVDDANDVPVVHAFLPDQDGKTDTVFSFSFAVDAFTDQDPGDTLSYSAALRNGSGLPAWLSFDPALRLFSGTPLVGDEGIRFIRVTASDGRGGTVFDDFAISIAKPGNIGPVQNYPLPDQVLLVGGVFNYTLPEGTFTDPDSTQPLVYEADLAGGAPLPSWLTFNPATRTFQGFPGIDITAPLDIRMTVFDGSGGHVSDLFNLSFISAVTPAPPFLMQPLADQNAITGTEFKVVFNLDTFHDPKASPLTYTATTDSGLPLPAWLKFDGATRTFSGLPAEGDVGTFLVRVTAENASGLTANDVFRIAVSKAARDILYRVLLPGGSHEISNIGQVNIPSGIIGSGTHSYFYELTDLSTTSTPEGYSWLSPVVELGIFNGNNQPVTNFANPVEVCFNPTASQRVGYSSEDFVIGSSHDGGRSWTLLPTYLNSANGMFCATTAHFSLFTVFTRILQETLPVTGFAPGVTTILPDHPEVKPEENLGDLWVEIPSIEVQETVVGVPPLKDGWDLSWLGNRIGWLNTTAFPTWSGNSILTAHVVGSDGNPGLFYNLHNLRYGDRIIVHLNNQKYIYEVRSINLETDPQDRRIFHHEDYPWLTLVTCRNFDPETNTYLFRAVVRAVQVEITEE